MADNKTFAELDSTPFESATKQYGGVDYSKALIVHEDGSGNPQIATPAHPVPVTDALGATEVSLAAALVQLQALVAHLGEVQSSPTANTVLDRLKVIQLALAQTLAVAGTVSVANLPGDPATGTAQTAQTGSLASIDGKTPALVGGAVPVTLPASQINGAVATEATLGAAKTDLDTIAGRTPALVSGSVPVVLPASQINGAVATEVTLAAAKADLDTLVTRTPVQGQASAGASSPVVLPATQVSGVIATEATVAAAKADLDTLVARVPALGQAAEGSSTPVVLPASQITALTPLSQGTAITGSAMPSGGVGPLGWLSAIYTFIAARIPILGQGNAAGSIPVVLSSDGPFIANVGTTADAAVVSDANGTLSGKLRGLVKWAFERMPASLGQKLMAASLSIAIASDQSTLPTLVNDVSQMASILSVGGYVSVDLNGRPTVAVQITGSWTGVLVFEATVDGTNYTPVNGFLVPAGTLAQTTTAPGMWQFNVAGCMKFRVRASALSAGSPVVSLCSTVGNSVSATVTSNGKTLLTATGTSNSTGTIVPAVAGKRIKVTAYALFTASTTINTVTFKDNNSGTSVWTVLMQAISGTIFGANLAAPAATFIFATSAGNPLELANPAAQAVVYSVTYYTDDAS